MIGWKRTLAAALVAAGLGAHPASAAWLAPAGLAAGEAPSLAVARDGTAYVAFQRFDGANQRIVVATRAPSGGVGAPRDLPPAGRDAFAPVIAVDRQGNVTVAWMQGPAFVVQARTKPAGGDWDEAGAPLSTGPIAKGPSLAVADGGGAVV